MDIFKFRVDYGLKINFQRLFFLFYSIFFLTSLFVFFGFFQVLNKNQHKYLFISLKEKYLQQGNHVTII